MKTCQVSIPSTPFHKLDLLVLEHSIRSRTQSPLDIKLMPQHEQMLTRANINQNTPFGYTRFLVPSLWGYRGVSLFMDPDMLFLCDIQELFDQFDPKYAVQVVKHDYTPRRTTKLIGNTEFPQFAYPRKNWSSLILFNNAVCKSLLTYDYVNTASGTELHQFKGIPDELIGGLDPSFNVLVGEDNQSTTPKVLHFTNGMPYTHLVESSIYDVLWESELAKV